MNNTNVKAIIIAYVVLGANLATSGETPRGWFPAGSHPKQYEMSVDHTVVHSGKASAYLKSIVPKTGGFGTLMQTFKADAFRGKRVRMSGYVRSEEVSDWAGLWMRVDGPQIPNSQMREALAFDNMQDRPIKATSDWTRYEIVLDVPEQAQEIAFGLLLTGQGQVWMDDLKFEVVGKDVATTGQSRGEGVHKEPANLSFEE
jgi:hypothetical protein